MCLDKYVTVSSPFFPEGDSYTQYIMDLRSNITLKCDRFIRFFPKKLPFFIKRTNLPHLFKCDKNKTVTVEQII